MKWHENRPLAWVALALCALVSVFGLGGMSLARARGQALAVFDDGTAAGQEGRHCMDAYLDGAAECAQIMAAEAVRLKGDTAASDAVAAQAAILGSDSAGLSARAAAYAALNTEVDRLYNETYTDDKAAFAPFKLAYDDFWGDDDLIRHDAYPALARSYNARISGFPARMVASVTGNGALETFGG